MLTNPLYLHLNFTSTCFGFTLIFSCLRYENAFNQQKALVGAFSVIIKLDVIFGNLRLKL